MKNTGVVRKIDELGRIVIPKEIRKNLSIHNGEDVQIYVEEDKIILQKYQKIESIKEKVSKYLEKISKLYSGDIYITDRECIIASSSNKKIGEKIDSKIFSLIDERKSYLGSDLKCSDKVNYYLIPMIYESNAVGSIILASDKNISENDKTFAEILNILVLTEMN